MPTSTVENYIKQIYAARQETPERLVPLGKLASALSVVPGTVTTMVKALSEARLVHYEPRCGVRLTEAGEKLALHVLRRHRLVELFLVEVLGFDWSEVHEEAEELEHVISDRLLEKIDAHLGHPDVDPHGDPIPTAEGELSSRPVRSLSTCEAGELVRIARVSDQDAEFLRYATERGLTPGTAVLVDWVDRSGDAVCVRVGEAASWTLGGLAAGKILVDAGEAGGGGV